jgi:hypothetical protein
MTTNIQKEKEFIFAHQLATSLGEDWVISFPPDELEWPDLIVNDGVNNFGLEVREFTKDQESKKGSKLRESESKNRSLVAKLARKYYQQSEVPIKVNILRDISNEHQILSALIEFSRTHNAWDSDRLDLDGVTIIQVTRLPDELGQYSHWKYLDDRIGWVRRIGISEIALLITEKEKKLKKYRTHLEDVRLMLVADPTFSSGMISFECEGLIASSDFNEVYLLIHPNDVHKLFSY